MGGFQLFKRPDPPPPRPIDQEKDNITQDLGSFIRILDFRDVLQHELWTIVPLTSEAEIKDRGKSDGIGKFIVLFQTAWFIIQCIARGIKHLPLTELEIVTLAYSMMNFFVYIFWWDKPRNVGCPIRIYENLAPNHMSEERDSGLWEIVVQVMFYIIGAQDQFTVLPQERRVPIFWSGGVEDSDSGWIASLHAALGPSIVGMAFGAMHCIAWSYEFPSHTELVLWHISCVTMMAVPLLSAVACALVSIGESPQVIVIFAACLILLVLSAWLYIAARIATIVMAFTTLRSLPSEAFTVVDWTTFIPHI
jgi:hypothetical protein